MPSPYTEVAGTNLIFFWKYVPVSAGQFDDQTLLVAITNGATTNIYSYIYPQIPNDASGITGTLVGNFLFI